jgi:hypothetical protein
VFRANARLLFEAHRKGEPMMRTILSAIFATLALCNLGWAA